MLNLTKISRSKLIFLCLTNLSSSALAVAVGSANPNTTNSGPGIFEESSQNTGSSLDRAAPQTQRGDTDSQLRLQALLQTLQPALRELRPVLEEAGFLRPGPQRRKLGKVKPGCFKGCWLWLTTAAPPEVGTKELYTVASQDQRELWLGGNSEKSGTVTCWSGIQRPTKFNDSDSDLESNSDRESTSVPRARAMGVDQLALPPPLVIRDIGKYRRKWKWDKGGSAVGFVDSGIGRALSVRHRLDIGTGRYVWTFDGKSSGLLTAIQPPNQGRSAGREFKLGEIQRYNLDLLVQAVKENAELNFRYHYRIRRGGSEPANDVLQKLFIKELRERTGWTGAGELESKLEEGIKGLKLGGTGADHLKKLAECL